MESLMWLGVAAASMIVGGVFGKLTQFFLNTGTRYELFAFVPYMVSSLLAIISPVVFIGSVIAAVVAAIC